MKLLHLTNLYPPVTTGVAERQCRLIVGELANRGHFNRVLTSDIATPNMHDRETFALRRLRLAPSGEPQPFMRVLRNERRNMSVLRDELDHLHPDVVVVWSMNGLSNSMLWELQRLGIRCVFAVLDAWPRHRLREDPWLHWWIAPLALRQRLMRRALRALRFDRPLHARFPIRRPIDMRFHRAFFTSRALRDSVRAAGFTVEGSEVIPCCVGRDEIPGQPQRRDEIRRLLWIGHLDTDRDPMTAIQAVQELRHEGEMRFSLDIFGRGDVGFESRLHDYVRDAQLAGAVTIRHASVEEIVGLFPTYDVFLYTARHPEPFPIVLLRAMAARMPIISTLEGSCADVIRKGETALVFRTGDPADCARRILEIAADRTRSDQMTERAYRELLDNFSALTVAGRVERLLNEVLRSRGGW